MSERTTNKASRAVAEGEDEKHEEVKKTIASYTGDEHPQTPLEQADHNEEECDDDSKQKPQALESIGEKLKKMKKGALSQKRSHHHKIRN